MQGLSDNMRGALLMMGSMAAFTFNDACMKALSGDLPLFQALFLRGVAVTVILTVVLRPGRAMLARIGRRDLWLIALRTGAEIGAAYFFVTALFNAPLANVTAIIQAIPLTVTLAGALFLGEAVGWRRMAAIAVGFAGVMLIVRPGTEGFTFASVYALVAVGFVTLRDLTTRRLSRDVPSVAVALAAAAGVTLFAGLGTLGQPWAPVDATSAAQLAGAVVFVIGGYLFSVMVMRAGDIGFIAPFRYTSLIWALILGFAVFGDWPAPLTLIGATVVVATGIFTLWRERKLASKAPQGLRPR